MKSLTIGYPSLLTSDRTRKASTSYAVVPQVRRFERGSSDLSGGKESFRIGESGEASRFFSV